MASTLSVVLMEIVQKAMEAQNLSTTRSTIRPGRRRFTTSTSSSTGILNTTSPSTFPKGALDIPHSPRCPTSTENLTRLSLEFLSNCSTNVTNTTSNPATTPAADELSTSYWALALLLIPTFTLFGNLLVIISVVKCRSLHSPINYFILGLAIADMCVAMAVMPFAVYVEFNNNWELGTLLCDLYCAADVTCSTASIFLLTVISFDRYVAATQPIRYANSAKGIGRVAAINLAVWLVSMLIASPMVLGLNNVPERDETKCMFYNADFIIYSSTGSFCIPLVIIIYLYGRIYCVIRERSRFAQQRRLIMGGTARYSVGGDVQKTVVMCAPPAPTVAAAPPPQQQQKQQREQAQGSNATNTRSGSGEDSPEKDHLLSVPSALENLVNKAKQNGVRKRSKTFESGAANGCATNVTAPPTKLGSSKFSTSRLALLSSPLPTFKSKPTTNVAPTVTEKRRNRFKRASTQTADSSSEIRCSSRFSVRSVRSESGTGSAATSSLTSSTSSASSREDLDEVCEYGAHVDLIRHLQKTSHKLASRRHRIPDGKRMSILFTGACNSFLKNVRNAVNDDGNNGKNGSKRFSWHPSTSASTTGCSSSQTRASAESDCYRVDSISSPAQYVVSPCPLLSRSRSVSITEDCRSMKGMKPSLSASVSLNPSVVDSSWRAHSASPICPPELPKILLHPQLSMDDSAMATSSDQHRRRFRTHAHSLCSDIADDDDDSSLCIANGCARGCSLSVEDEMCRPASPTPCSIITSNLIFKNNNLHKNYDTFKPFALSETTIVQTPTTVKSVARRNTVAPLISKSDELLDGAKIIENVSADDCNSPPKSNGLTSITSSSQTNGCTISVARTTMEDPTTTTGSDPSLLTLSRPKSAQLSLPPDPHSGASSKWFRRLSTRMSVWRRSREMSLVVSGGNRNSVLDANKCMAMAAAAVISTQVQPTGDVTASLTVPAARLAPPKPPKQPKGLKKMSKSQKKEKKATKTLAIVLGIFLICWLPFFTLNLLNAVCIKLEFASCQVGFLPFFLTTWLGYMNSLMNPIIYTIFNMDFRRAFKQILCPCLVKHRTRRV